MSEQGLIFSNARTKSLENGLLNNMQLARLTEAENLDEAFKILLECGYGGGVSVEDAASFETLLDYEREAATAFLRENCAKGSGLETLLTRVDYHNAKALMKAKYLRLADVGFMLYPDGNVPSALIKECVESDVYDKLPKPMATAMAAIDTAFSEENRSARYIDNLLDRALYEDVFIKLKKISQPILKKYFVTLVDTANLGSFLRVKKIGLGLKFFEEGFLAGGELGIAFYEGLYEATMEQFKEKIRYTSYAGVLNKALEEDNLTLYETAVDNYTLSLFRQERHNMFSIAPVAGYYLAKCTELKVVKLVVAAIKNNVDKALLRQRLRELYA